MDELVATLHAQKNGHQMKEQEGTPHTTQMNIQEEVETLFFLIVASFCISELSSLAALSLISL